MSEDLQKKIDELTNENKKHLQTIQQQQDGIDGMMSQIDAHREQLNEALNLGLTLRTNVIHLKKMHEKLTHKYNELKKNFDGVNQQFEDSTKRIADLEKQLEKPKK